MGKPFSPPPPSAFIREGRRKTSNNENFCGIAGSFGNVRCGGGQWCSRSYEKRRIFFVSSYLGYFSLPSIVVDMEGEGGTAICGESKERETGSEVVLTYI